MEITIELIVFSIITLILISLLFYLIFHLNLKKRNGKTLNQKLSDLSKKIHEKQNNLVDITAEMEERKDEFQLLKELKKNEKSIQHSIDKLSVEQEDIQKEIKLLEESREELKIDVSNMKDEVAIYYPTKELINVGFIDEPKYLFETSERFREEIKIIREKQKELINDKNAIIIPHEIAVTSNQTIAKKVLAGQTKLMLKTFNIECDNLMSMLKTSNYAKTLEKIDRLASDIEKTSVSLKCGFHKEYIDLKFQECELQYQFKLKSAREKEEQTAIREQIREEEKVRREYERAIQKAEKEEKVYRESLEIARKELSTSGEVDNQKLMERINLLEKLLQEAEENKLRAKSLAEQTRRGHVYIISNIGSFGEGVYKIGLTRRLEPMDRVKELGDASVPFRFDVHAIIYNEDAPALESALHKEFNHLRVNQVNRRKEFFRVSLNEIKEKVIEITGSDADFQITKSAEEYYESLKLQSEHVEVLDTV